MKEISILLLLALFSISSCSNGSIDDLEYNLLADTEEALIAVISSEVIFAGGSTKRVKFNITNRYNELNDLQKENITSLVVVTPGFGSEEFEADVTEFTTKRFDPFTTYCFKFSFGNEDGEQTRETDPYCIDL